LEGAKAAIEEADEKEETTEFEKTVVNLKRPAPLL